MKRRSWYSTTEQLKQVLWNLALMAAGSVLCALTVNGLLLPQQFFGAGFTGVALLVHYGIPSLPVAWIYVVLNIPVFALGWLHVGRRFFLYSIGGMVIFSTSLALVHFPISIEDKILNALLAGILMGTGSGVILRSLGSAGGLDILSVMLLRRFSIRIGSTILGFNAVILAAGAALFSLEGALYTLVYIYVNAHVVNLVVTGLSQRKAVFIISPKWETISRDIMERLNRGVTVIHGHGGYTRQEERILYAVITFRELPQLKQLVRQEDPSAFMVISDTLEVMGQRIGNQPHW